MDEFIKTMTKTEYIEVLKYLIENKGLIEHLDKRFDGEKIEYVKDDEKAKRFASFGGTETCYNMATVNLIIYDVVSKSVEAIADWLMSPKASLGIHAKYDAPIGYTLDAEGNRNETNLVKVVFRREVPGTTEYGFSISAVIPYV